MLGFSKRKDYIIDEDMEYQLIPPHIHRMILTERAIKVFKDHLLACLAMIEPTFPIHLWCRSFPKATISLNMMRTSRIHPSLSAYHELMGICDYNKTPFALIGVKVLIHEKPSVSKS